MNRRGLHGGCCACDEEAHDGLLAAVVCCRGACCGWGLSSCRDTRRAWEGVGAIKVQSIRQEFVGLLEVDTAPAEALLASRTCIRSIMSFKVSPAKASDEQHADQNVTCAQWCAALAFEAVHKFVAVSPADVHTTHGSRHITIMMHAEFSMCFSLP